MGPPLPCPIDSQAVPPTCGVFGAGRCEQPWTSDRAGDPRVGINHTPHRALTVHRHRLAPKTPQVGGTTKGSQGRCHPAAGAVGRGVEGRRGRLSIGFTKGKSRYIGTDLLRGLRKLVARQSCVDVGANLPETSEKIGANNRTLRFRPVPAALARRSQLKRREAAAGISGGLWIDGRAHDAHKGGRNEDH